MAVTATAETRARMIGYRSGGDPMKDRDASVTMKRYLDAVAGTTCGDCHELHDHRHCQAHAKQRGGQQCERFPTPGQHICAIHGGHSPRAVQAAETERAERRARSAIGKLEYGPIDNPLLALSLLAGEAEAWKQKIAELVEGISSVRYSTDGGEAIRGEIQLFERAMDRCNAILTSIARLNLDERMVRITEQQVGLVKSALQRSLTDIGMPAEQQLLALAGVARYLRPSPN